MEVFILLVLIFEKQNFHHGSLFVVDLFTGSSTIPSTGNRIRTPDTIYNRSVVKTYIAISNNFENHLKISKKTAFFKVFNPFLFVGFQLCSALNGGYKTLLLVNDSMNFTWTLVSMGTKNMFDINSLSTAILAFEVHNDNV